MSYSKDKTVYFNPLFEVLYLINYFTSTSKITFWVWQKENSD